MAEPTASTATYVKFQPAIAIEKQIYKDEKITNLFLLNKEILKPIYEALNAAYQKHEKMVIRPAGYEYHLKMIDKGNKPIEFVLEACELRDTEQMEMPVLKGNRCAFDNAEIMKGYEEAQNQNAKVIKSRNDNPLAVPVKHSDHFFKNTIDEQIDITLVAVQALKIKTKEKCSSATITFHIGTKGHQSFPHTHAKIMHS